MREGVDKCGGSGPPQEAGGHWLNICLSLTDLVGCGLADMHERVLNLGTDHVWRFEVCGRLHVREGEGMAVFFQATISWIRFHSEVSCSECNSLPFPL